MGFWPEYDEQGRKLKRVIVDIETYDGPELVHAECDDDAGKIPYNFILIPEDQPEPNVKPRRSKARRQSDDEPVGNLLNVPETADYLHVSEKTIRRRCKDGSLRQIRIGRKILFDRADLDEFLKAQKRTEPRAASAVERFGRPKQKFDSEKALRNIGMSKKGKR